MKKFVILLTVLIMGTANFCLATFLCDSRDYACQMAETQKEQLKLQKEQFKEMQRLQYKQEVQTAKDRKCSVMLRQVDDACSDPAQGDYCGYWKSVYMSECTH